MLNPPIHNPCVANAATDQAISVLMERHTVMPAKYATPPTPPTLNTDKVWSSSVNTSYYFVHTDTKKEVPIARFWPSSMPTFWVVELGDGTQLVMHYQRILVKKPEVPPLV